ncbi:uncharacterized protein LOC124272847 [Haliotis rubra]|uniref:uncharacterized protein LOC124272847 n=1 Tax=Haliotis rubra TaxID=36100 RepID=UPI001EE52FA0|nr:uncharacterized protein LOC124272847 [Haliotis rubra]
MHGLLWPRQSREVVGTEAAVAEVTVMEVIVMDIDVVVVEGGVVEEDAAGVDIVEVVVEEKQRWPLVESDEYDNSGQPSCRCPFQFQGQQGWSQRPQFGSVGYGRQSGQRDGYYRQWYRAFSTHPCCGGRTGTITFLQRTQRISPGPR